MCKLSVVMAGLNDIISALDQLKLVEDERVTLQGKMRRIKKTKKYWHIEKANEVAILY